MAPTAVAGHILLIARLAQQTLEIAQVSQMSMVARTEQFHTDAQRPKDKNTPKDIDKLRKFLFKNQAYRFTDRDQSHLLQAIQLYVTMYSSSPEPGSPALNLVEDALKMPFTMFTTGQKKSMLKWLDRLNGLEAAAAAGGEAAAGTEQQQQYSVLDVTSDVAEVMNDEGETQQVQLAVCDTELVDALRRAFQAEQEVQVQLGTRHGQAAITKMTVQ